MSLPVMRPSSQRKSLFHILSLADRIQHAENTKNYTETRLVDIKEQREQRYIECKESALDYEQERLARL